jgi:DNA-binding transcriptional regulator YiaG
MKDNKFIDIPGYEGLYEINRKGEIWSNYKKGKILIPQPDKDGYLTLTFCKNKKRFGVKIHRLVAQIFIPNPDNLPQVNHKDGNKENNWDWNLEWATNSSNQKHAYTTGLKSPNDNQKRAASKNGRLSRKFDAETVKSIRKIREETGLSYEKIARNYNVNGETIRNMVLYKTYSEVN